MLATCATHERDEDECSAPHGLHPAACSAAGPTSDRFTSVYSDWKLVPTPPCLAIRPTRAASSAAYRSTKQDGIGMTGGGGKPGRAVFARFAVPGIRTIASFRADSAGGAARAMLSPRIAVGTNAKKTPSVTQTIADPRGLVRAIPSSRFMA